MCQLAWCGQVGADITRLQEDAKGIKERLKTEHSENKSVQTTKILSNFEVRHRRPGLPAWIAISASFVPASACTVLQVESSS